MLHRTIFSFILLLAVGGGREHGAAAFSATLTAGRSRIAPRMVFSRQSTSFKIEPTSSAAHADENTAAISSFTHSTVGADAVGTTRRAALTTALSLPVFWASRAGASHAKASIKPDAAFDALLKAREELQVAGQIYLPKRDFDGLREYLEGATNINAYEANAGALLESKRLDAESKKDIGTIRRYGVGADVMIMYGGLRNEIDENNENPNYGEVVKYI